MNSCFNVLDKPEVFIAVAALIVIVLLVWAQLSSRGNLNEDFNLVFGIAWTYLAILFTLIAVAIFVYDPVKSCAKGFLVLSLLMTMTNVLISFGLILLRLTLIGKVSESLTAKDRKGRRVWILFWLFALFGLSFISFSVSGVLEHPCIWRNAWFWVGVGLVVIAAIISIVLIPICKRLCVYIKWYCWKLKKWGIARYISFCNCYHCLCACIKLCWQKCKKWVISEKKSE